MAREKWLQGPSFDLSDQPGETTNKNGYDVVKQALSFGVFKTSLEKADRETPSATTPCKHQQPKQIRGGIWDDPYER